MWGDAFRRGVYREHLEEISFLHEHRAQAFEEDADEAFVAGLEARLEAHVDGLVLGGAEALALCTQRAVEGDAGELHGALRVFCRRDEPARAFAAIADVDLESAEVRRAIEEALAYELPRGWEPHVASWLADAASPLAAIAARVLGYRRARSSAVAVTDACTAASDPVPFLWALGRLGSAPASLVAHLHGPCTSAKTTAAIALLRSHDGDAPRRIAAEIERAPALAPALAIAAGRDLAGVLARLPAEGPVLVAMGLLGDPSAIEPLLAALAEPRAAEPAAIALHLLTGAGALCRDAASWRTWWQMHASAFALGTRWRLGAPASPRAIARSVTAPLLPGWVQRLTIDELVVRHGLCVELEHDMFVRDKQAALRRADAAVVEGRWYYGGRAV